jgi:hypothetical protein
LLSQAGSDWPRMANSPEARAEMFGHIRREAKQRLAGGEEGFLSESAARGHVPPMQDQYGSAAATLDAVLDRVTVDGGRSGGRSLAHGSDSAHRSTISAWASKP